MALNHFFSQGEIVQAPFYKKYKPSDGVRCVWFPIDENDFMFQDYDTGSIGDEAATAQTVTLRQPVFNQWAINMTGITPGQTIRFHICSYYECIPDEVYKDIYMAKRNMTPGNPANSTIAISTMINKGVGATAAKSSPSFQNHIDGAMKMIDSVGSNLGLIKDIGTAAYNAGRMYGPYLAQAAKLMF